MSKGEISPEDYAEIGHAVVMGVASMAMFGWSSPGGILEYVEDTDDWRRQLVIDLFRSARIGPQGDPSRTALAQFAAETQIMDDLASAIAT